MQQRHFRSICLVVLIAGILVGCQRATENTTVTTVTVADPSPTATAPVTPTPTAEPSPSPTPRPSPTPSPTPLPTPFIRASDQPMDRRGQLVLDEVQVQLDGFVVLSTIPADATQEEPIVLGYVPVAAGLQTSVTVEVPPLAVTPRVRARLVADVRDTDEGLTITPLADEIATDFRVTPTFALPRLDVRDQMIAVDGVYTVTEAIAFEPGWIAIYNDVDGAPGEIVGAHYVREGESAAVPVRLQWRQATPQLHVRLLADAGTPERLDPDDPVVMVRNQPVTSLITAYYPPDVLIYSQPPISRTITVERAISYGPGWITIVRDGENGLPENIVGYAPLADGVNEKIVIPLLESADTTEQMYVALHVDDKDMGEFDFPDGDAILRYDNEPVYIPFDAQPGNYLIARPQTLTEDREIVVERVIVDIPIWLTARAAAGDAPGDVLGLRYLTPGVHRNITLTLDAPTSAEQLFIVMHVDNGEQGVFEFPDGLDFELQLNRRIIAILLPLR